MKLQHLITFLAIGLLLPLSAKAATYSADGVNYTYTAGNETSAVVASVDPSATSLIIHKNFTVDGTTYTVGKIDNGKIVSASATTVTFDGPWALESNISGTQFYNLSAVERYYVTNPNTNTSANDPETGEHYGKLQAGDDGVLYMYHSATEIHMLAYPCKKTDTEYTVPANVNNIQASAFRNNEYLETINLCNELRLIRNEAFAGCTNLKAINAGAGSTYFQTVNGVLFQIGTLQNGDLSKFYPAGVTYHKTLAAYPAGLPATSYEVPADVVILARSCFYGATNLQTITFASGTALQEIREFAFNKCENLENLTIPASVQYINMAYVDAPINPMGEGAQVGTYTYAPSSVNKKAYAASAQGTFNHCKKLKLAVDPSSNYFKVEDDVLFSKDGTRLVRYGCTKTFPGYIVPSSVLWIDSYAFDCTQVAHVVLPSKLSEVSRNLFEDAKNLDFITIPPLVGTNVNYADGAISDTRSTRKSINQDAFKGCDNLKEVFMMPENAPILHNADVFGSSNPTIYVKPNTNVNNDNNGNVDKAINIYDNYKAAANYPSSKIEYNIPITLNEYGMATMCRDFAVQLQGNIKAYNIPTNGGSNEYDDAYKLTLTQLNMSEGQFITSRTGTNYDEYNGVLLKTTDESTSGFYQISVEDFANHFNLRGIYCGQTGGTTEWKKPRSIKKSSTIIGTPVETNIDVTDNSTYTNFGFKGNKFQRVAAPGMVKCNKAYLHQPIGNVPGKVPAYVSGAKITMIFLDTPWDELDEQETTAIQEVNAETANVANAGIVYNLNGYPVGNAADLQQGNLPKGMYILNGKKYIVK